MVVPRRTSLSLLTNLQVLSICGCSGVTELPGLCDLIALQTLELINVVIARIPDLQKLVHLQNLTVSYCEHLTSLSGVEHLTLLQRLDATKTDCSKLKKLEVVDLSYSGVCVLRRSDFERLGKHRILKMEGCAGLFELHVVWLLVQRGQLRWAPVCEWLRFVSRRWGRHSSVVHRIHSNSKDDFTHDMDEAVLCPLATSWFRLAQMKYTSSDLKSHLLSAGILISMDGGVNVDAVVTALCEDDDLGILSSVVAKYLATINLILSESKLYVGVLYGFSKCWSNIWKRTKWLRGGEGVP